MSHNQKFLRESGLLNDSEKAEEEGDKKVPAEPKKSEGSDSKKAGEEGDKSEPAEPEKSEGGDGVDGEKVGEEGDSRVKDEADPMNSHSENSQGLEIGIKHWAAPYFQENANYSSDWMSGGFLVNFFAVRVENFYTQLRLGFHVASQIYPGQKGEQWRVCLSRKGEDVVMDVFYWGKQEVFAAVVVKVKEDGPKKVLWRGRTMVAKLFKSGSPNEVVLFKLEEVMDVFADGTATFAIEIIRQLPPTHYTAIFKDGILKTFKPKTFKVYVKLPSTTVSPVELKKSCKCHGLLPCGVCFGSGTVVGGAAVAVVAVVVFKKFHVCHEIKVGVLEQAGKVLTDVVKVFYGALKGISGI